MISTQCDGMLVDIVMPRPGSEAGDGLAETGKTKRERMRRQGAQGDAVSHVCLLSCGYAGDIADFVPAEADWPDAIK